jgi:nitrite reductase/ring-hydroxylating ferredoxin subunit
VGVRARALARAAIYQRSIAASVARIWENVLDWEHLPWLHRTSFAAVRVLEQSANGWRAWVTTAAPRRQEALIDVRLDRTALRYVTRTLEGDGAGTEISTLLTASDERATRIHVRFDVPESDAARLEAIGAAFRRLYARLWDEDEAMMTRRQAVLDEAGGFAPIQSISLGRLDGEVIAYPTICPHLGGPLDDAPLEAGCVTCPWHGYRYDLRSGRCVSGKPLALGPLPLVVVDRDGGEASLTW